MGKKTNLKKLVLDTNIVISALLFGGSAGHLVTLWKNKTIHLLCSAALLQEITRVLSYPKFDLAETGIRDLIHDEILPFITPVVVKNVPHIIEEDPSDNHVLGCAEQGHADAIVTGDQHLLKIKIYKKIPILTLKDCLEKLNIAAN
ncbi:MAG: putative toxin-antitoxin system toxin component, PIN family [Elusimicrobia bacterium]|nr:putative toxin-antitoxin system toxin component, PIN family [Candidatus Obscuribacterium magneticum]